MNNVFTSEYGGIVYKEGTTALLMKQELDRDVARMVVAFSTKSVIDIGGGNGNLYHYIAQASSEKEIPIPSYTVMDSSPSQLSVANDAGFSTIQNSMIAPQSVFQAPFAGKELFEAAVMENALYAVTMNLRSEEVTRARTLALTNAASIIKEDGVLVISDPLVKDRGTFFKKLGKYVQREKELKMKQGASNAEANWYVLRKLTSKHVLNSLKQTGKLAKTTTRFKSVQELIEFVEGTGYFEVIRGSVRDDAYLGDNALVAFKRTNKAAAYLPENEQRLSNQSQIERISVLGEPKYWSPELMEQFYDLEHKAYEVYQDEAADRMEGLEFVDDFFLTGKGEKLFTNARKVSITGIKSTFYYDRSSNKPIAFLSLIEADIHEPFLWHGIVIPKGRILIPRKLMKDKNYVTDNPLYWDDIYAEVANVTRRHGTVTVAAHFQPLSLKEMIKAGIVDPEFHANLQNHFKQSREQIRKIQFVQNVLRLPEKLRFYILSAFHKGPDKVQKIEKVLLGLRKIEKIAPLLNTIKTAFIPDSNPNSGFVVVQLHQNESKR